MFPIGLLEAKIPMLSITKVHICGILHIQDHLKPKTAEQIMTDFSLPDNMIFSCLRISHFLKSHPIPRIKIPTKAWWFYSTPTLTTRGISLFYNLIHDKQIFGKTAAVRKWEIDLGTTFSDYQWQYAFREIHKASHCVNYWERMLKITNSWRYTPYRLATFFPDTLRLEEMWPNWSSSTHPLGLPKHNRLMEQDIPDDLINHRNFNTPQPSTSNPSSRNREIPSQL